jgi:predicted metalloprotease with PDZ domain
MEVYVKLAAFVFLATTGLAFGAPMQPQPMPRQAPVISPQDKPFPGEITLQVDATDLDRHIFNVHEIIPVTGSEPVTLLFPKWIPGAHGPVGPIRSLAGLTVTVDGKPVAWQRDPVDIYAFHIDRPVSIDMSDDSAPSAESAAPATMDVRFQFLSPTDESGGRVIMTPEMLDTSWSDLVLYPAGYFARDISFHPSLTLPEGWQYGTALDTESRNGATVTFKPVPLDTLIDSPVYAGTYFQRFDLNPNGQVPVHLDVFADRPEDMVVRPEDLQAHRNLVQQAFRNFGGYHFNHYDFLFSLSDEMGGSGLEHHRSSEDGTKRTYFTSQEALASRDLLAHEFTHSWNGKYRRPADLWSPDYNEFPERDSLLWVYEGQTEYWGQVLAARSGVLKQADARDLIALEAAMQNAEAGRVWRDLQDTTNDPILNQRRPLDWPSYSRAEDYYVEGLLIWLDADTLIREKTRDAKSLTDFARAFFGMDNGTWGEKTYRFKDIVQGLNAVAPNDWSAFLTDRLQSHGPGAPLDGLTRGGWKLVFTETKSPTFKSYEARRKQAEFRFSIGLSMDADHTIGAVQWNSAAFKAGLAKGVKLLAVNGLAYEGEKSLNDAIVQAKTSHDPIELLIQDQKHFRTVKVDYHEGLRYPHLQRIDGVPDRLDAILSPLPG